MNWAEVIADPNLNDLPYKIELNQWGNIEMSPASIRHVAFQARIFEMLRAMLKKGRIMQEFPVETAQGVKVPDVVWISEQSFDWVKDRISSPIAPEICVEVMSPGNSNIQIIQKGKLYFECGAKEFWICDENGDMNFFSADGKLEHSELVINFPANVEI